MAHLSTSVAVRTDPSPDYSLWARNVSFEGKNLLHIELLVDQAVCGSGRDHRIASHRYKQASRVLSLGVRLLDESPDKSKPLKFIFEQTRQFQGIYPTVLAGAQVIAEQAGVDPAWVEHMRHEFLQNCFWNRADHGLLETKPVSSSEFCRVVHDCGQRLVQFYENERSLTNGELYQLRCITGRIAAWYTGYPQTHLRTMKRIHHRGANSPLTRSTRRLIKMAREELELPTPVAAPKILFVGDVVSDMSAVALEAKHRANLIPIPDGASLVDTLKKQALPDIIMVGGQFAAEVNGIPEGTTSVREARGIPIMVCGKPAVSISEVARRYLPVQIIPEEQDGVAARLKALHRLCLKRNDAPDPDSFWIE